MAAAHGCEASVVSLVKAGADTGFILAGGLTVLHMVSSSALTSAQKDGASIHIPFLLIKI